MRPVSRTADATLSAIFRLASWITVSNTRMVVSGGAAVDGVGDAAGFVFSVGGFSERGNGGIAPIIRLCRKAISAQPLPLPTQRGHHWSLRKGRREPSGSVSV